MNNNEVKQFAMLIGLLGETFDRKVSETTIKAYLMALDDLPLEVINRGVQKAMKACKFFPKPAEIREMSGAMSLEHRADLAWKKLCDAVQRHGFWKSPDFDDKAINATITITGGWIQISEKEGDDFDIWYQKDFKRTYIGFCENGVSVELAAPLVGMHEKNNRHTNRAIPKGMEQACGLLPTPITTGLPMLPNCTPEPAKRIENANRPRLELKRPPEETCE